MTAWKRYIATLEFHKEFIDTLMMIGDSLSSTNPCLQKERVMSSEICIHRTSCVFNKVCPELNE